MDNSVFPTPKYKIGQILYLKQDISNLETNYKKVPPSLVVVEITIQQCIGGFQIFYHFRMFGTNPSSLIPINEVELTDVYEVPTK